MARIVRFPSTLDLWNRCVLLSRWLAQKGRPLRCRLVAARLRHRRVQLQEQGTNAQNDSSDVHEALPDQIADRARKASTHAISALPGALFSRGDCPLRRKEEKSSEFATQADVSATLPAISCTPRSGCNC
jgi:hypothetical protein